MSGMLLSRQEKVETLVLNFPCWQRLFFLVFPDGRKETSGPLPWIENVENDYIEHAPGLATEPSNVMFVTRDGNKTFRK